MKKLLTLLTAILCCGVLLAFAACGETDAPDADTQTATDATSDTTTAHPRVRFVYSTGDVITVELYPEFAPISVANFLQYVKEGFYRGTVIHRVENYVIQGGGYVYKNGAYAYKTPSHADIKGEFLANGVDNRVSHTAGAISMARTNAYDSASTQYFFCPYDYTGWDGYYAAFGHVVDESSLTAIRRLTTVATENTQPVEAIILNSVTILD